VWWRPAAAAGWAPPGIGADILCRPVPGIEKIIPTAETACSRPTRNCSRCQIGRHAPYRGATDAQGSRTRLPAGCGCRDIERPCTAPHLQGEMWWERMAGRDAGRTPCKPPHIGNDDVRTYRNYR